MTIAVTGSIATDHLMHFPGRFSEQLLADHLQKVSLSFLVDDLVIRRGGVGGNIAFGMGALGGDVAWSARSATTSTTTAAGCRRHGVDCDNVYLRDRAHRPLRLHHRRGHVPDRLVLPRRDVRGPQHRARRRGVVTSAAGPGAHQRQRPRGDGACTPRNAASSGFASPPTRPSRSPGCPGEEIGKLIDGAAYLFTNDYERSCCCPRPAVGGRHAEQVGLRVTTLGTKGVEIVERDGPPCTSTWCPETSKADPTGVGDAFRAGFLTGRSAGLSLERSAQLGSLVAVLVLEIDRHPGVDVGPRLRRDPAGRGLRRRRRGRDRRSGLAARQLRRSGTGARQSCTGYTGSLICGTTAVLDEDRVPDHEDQQRPDLAGVVVRRRRGARRASVRTAARSIRWSACDASMIAWAQSNTHLLEPVPDRHREARAWPG